MDYIFNVIAPGLFNTQTFSGPFIVNSVAITPLDYMNPGEGFVLHINYMYFSLIFMPRIK